MSTSDSGDLALIDSWVNDAVEQFNRETKLNVATAALSVTADVDDYSLPAEILSMQALWYSSTDAQSALLEPLAPETLVQRRLFQAVQDTYPRYYALAGANTLMLYPTPSDSSDTLHVLYVPKHTALAATADTPSATANGNIPAEYHPVLEMYVKWKACEAEEHKPSDNGEKFERDWMSGVAQVRGDIKKKAGMALPSVRIGRARTFPLGPGIDVR
jgi:hypothetical protein